MKKSDAFVSVRYIVNDVDAAVKFYRDLFDFEVVMNPNTGFAMLTRGNLRLLLNQPGAGGAGKPMPDGTKPTPGGFNRIQFEVDDLESMITKLKSKGAKFRNEIVTAPAGDQILVSDPSGNLIELFESKEVPVH
jgi:predicted enzyme related to lactoylglutathione lyase